MSQLKKLVEWMEIYLVGGLNVKYPPYVNLLGKAKQLLQEEQTELEKLREENKYLKAEFEANKDKVYTQFDLNAARIEGAELGWDASFWRREYIIHEAENDKLEIKIPWTYPNTYTKSQFLSSLGEAKEDSGWISVEDSPLYINTENGWECTDAAESEFWAALEYNDKNYPNKTFWWIHRCVVEDEIGLCIVGDIENEPAGWTLQDVTHYKPINLVPPNKKP